MKYLNNPIFIELKNELKDLGFNAISEYFIKELEEIIQSHEISMSIFDSDMFKNCLNKEEIEFAYNQYVRLCNEFDMLNTDYIVTGVVCSNPNIEKTYAKLIHDMTQETLDFIDKKAEEKIKTLNN